MQGECSLLLLPSVEESDLKYKVLRLFGPDFRGEVGGLLQFFSWEKPKGICSHNNTPLAAGELHPL